ncbi:MAG: sulfite exporter TauE/SafE family protein [Ignavibacteria bacterium]
MNEYYLLTLLIAAGYFTGILVGMLGIGGGLIFVPLLYLILPFTKVDPSQISYIALGTSLFSGSIATVTSGTKHFLKKNTDSGKAVLIASGSIIASFIFPFFVVNVKPFFLQIIFAFIFIFAAVRMYFEKGSSIIFSGIILSEKYLPAFGFLVGGISAFSGIGGGILFVPILVYLYGTEIKKAIGTSSIITACTMISSSLSYSIQEVTGFGVPYQIGYIYLIAGLPLGIASALGSLTGVKIVLKTSSPRLKKIFAVLLIVIVIKIIFGA